MITQDDTDFAHARAGGMLSHVDGDLYGSAPPARL